MLFGILFGDIFEDRLVSKFFNNNILFCIILIKFKISSLFLILNSGKVKIEFGISIFLDIKLFFIVLNSNIKFFKFLIN